MWDFLTHQIQNTVTVQKVTGLCACVSELVDCDKLDQACGGGLPSNAYEAIENLGKVLQRQK